MSLNAQISPTNETILKLAAVIAMTGLSRSGIYSLIGAGDFPKQIKLSVRSMGFLKSEVDAWIAARIAASRKEG
jgi:prophage regulatory protein